MENIIVRVIPLPLTVRAFTMPDSQGDYNIYINCCLSFEQQRKSFLHEQKHIYNGDFFSELSAKEIESAMKK